MSPGQLLKRGGTWLFVVKFAALALGLGAETLLANVMGLEEYDLWAAAASWLSILTVFVALGMNTTLVRGLPAAQARERLGARP